MTAKELAEKFNISDIIAEIMISRGLNTYSKAQRYLNAGIKNLYHPFMLTGVKEAADIIENFINIKSNIVIYGDYDADGICSVSILYLYLHNRGANVFWYIPEREEGYGINIEAVKYIKESYNPGLIITVDCGITSKNEIDYIKSSGIEVIVTDHHNSNGELPDCTIINPKICGNYPFKELCGAGVALKLVQALGGETEAKKYIDIAAIAAIADSVELSDENRDIVSEGIKLLNENRRQGIRLLCRTAGINEALNTFNIAFGIVPRINAAGRTGDARQAVALFYEDNEDNLNKLCRRLDAANKERQKLCEDILNTLKQDIDTRKEYYRHCIIVIDESGHDGVSGILASKLCEMYYRPSFVFCPFNGSLKGSGRSIESIDIFDMLQNAKDLFEKYGGHSFAAGVTLSRDNFEEFKRKADEYIKNKYGFKSFIKPLKYDYEITDNINPSFISQLELFEPCGHGNNKPRFLYRSERLNVTPLKKYPQHLSFKLFGIDVTAFNFAGRSDELNCSGVNIVLEFMQDEFRGKKYNKGYLKEVHTDADSAAEEKMLSNYILQYCRPLNVPDFELYDSSSTGSVLSENLRLFGTLIIVSFKETLNKLYELCPFLKDIKLSLFYSGGDGNNISRIALSPSWEFTAEGYNTVIFADTPFYSGYISRIGRDKKVFVPVESTVPHFACDYSLDREVFALYYRMITDQRAAQEKFSDIRKYYFNISRIYKGISYLQFVVCFKVFEELGFIKTDENGIIKVNSNVKKQLESSYIYNRLAIMQNGG